MSKKHKKNRRFTNIIIIVLIVAVAFFAYTSFTGGIDIRSDVTKLGLDSIGELATQAGYFTSVQSINSSRSLWGIEIPFTQSSYIFSYDGVIKAGIDFEKVTVDVNNIRKVINVALPEPYIISTEIDLDSLEVYNQAESIFTPLRVENMNEAMNELKSEAEASAIKNGLLENAKDNAKTLIKGFLAASYDMNTYSVVFTEVDE